jgi:F-type H+-transporting ATPase subunit gamma
MEQRHGFVDGRRRKRSIRVTRRRDLEHHRRSLGEIREIMNSMKTLAFLETRKLTRFIRAQQAVVESIEEVAADFLSFHADILPEVGESTPVFLVIGTERGFCGSFNQALAEHLKSALEIQMTGTPTVVAVGSRLHSLMDKIQQEAITIQGAGVVEEIPPVLNEIVHQLSTLQQRHAMLSVYGLFHTGNDGIVMQKLLPPFQHQQNQPRRYAHPPLLHLPPSQFLIQLTEHYLFAALHAMLYTSLMAESLDRMNHLESAVSHLDDKSEDLSRRCSAMRQEEIIEEIEVILLSSANLDEQGHRALVADSGDPR